MDSLDVRSLIEALQTIVEHLSDVQDNMRRIESDVADLTARHEFTYLVSPRTEERRQDTLYMIDNDTSLVSVYSWHDHEWIREK